MNEWEVAPSVLFLGVLEVKWVSGSGRARWWPLKRVSRTEQQVSAAKLVVVVTCWRSIGILLRYSLALMVCQEYLPPSSCRRRMQCCSSRRRASQCTKWRMCPSTPSAAHTTPPSTLARTRWEPRLVTKASLCQLYTSHMSSLILNWNFVHTNKGGYSNLWFWLTRKVVISYT